MRRVAILGGGMAGLAAAWHLTDPANPPVEVTVYQRGWRLGGKGASSRGVHGRIEEHGLHVWLGYYDNAFRLLRGAYDELDRPSSDPACPIATWLDAFTKASVVGLGRDTDDGWDDWLAEFPEDDRLPGEPVELTAGVTPTELVRRALALAARFGASLDGPRSPSPRAVLSSDPSPPAVPGPLADLGHGVGAGLRALTGGTRGAERTARFLEVLAAMVRGIVVDGIAARGFGAIDDVDLRDWLRHHGASSEAVDSPFVLGTYDLAFAYEGGDRGRPRFSAGTGLALSGRMFLDYKGALFWKMRAGMGDVVFAPLYEALRRRGVQFRFFHRLDALHPAGDGSHIAAVTLGRQVALRDGLDDYEPLVRVHGLPVFPDRPDLEQLDAGPELLGEPLESHWCTWPDQGTVRLEAGRDFDHLVLAVSLGMVPHVCAEVVDASPRWQAMVARVGTVATQAMQLWLRPDERTLGWDAPAATVTGCGVPFDTFASMSHTIGFEGWDPDSAPATAASFCAVLDDDLVPDDPDPVPGALAAVRAGAERFLDERVANLWPGAVVDGRFRHDLVVDDGRYLRANVDPSDRYVQSLPGSGAHRLRADGSGYANLALAGDWIDTGLNAGCIEAATLGGLQAANAVLGRPLHAGTSGFRPNAPAHA